MSLLLKKGKKALFEGDVYINNKTKEILKLQGFINNNLGFYVNRKDMKFKDIKYYFDINLKDYRGQAVFNSAKVRFSIDFIYKKLKYKTSISSYIFAYSIGGYPTSSKKLTKRSNIYDKISKLKYNQEFWESNQVIKKTPIEKDVISSFEQSGLFHNFKKSNQ